VDADPFGGVAKRRVRPTSNGSTNHPGSHVVRESVRYRPH